MSVEQFAKFKHKIRQLNAFVEAQGDALFAVGGSS